MKRIWSDLLFPIISEPIREGMLILNEKNTIVEVLSPSDKNYNKEGAQYFPGGLTPGFVNTHCHLELSHLKGKLNEKTGLDGFIEELSALRNASEKSVKHSAQEADLVMYLSGCAVVGDIANGSSSFDIKKKSKITYHTFVERFGLAESAAKTSFDQGLENLRTLKELGLSGSLSPHAPYSVSEKLFDLILNHCLKTNSVMSIHHQESDSENELFMFGSGPMRARFKKMGISDSGFKPKGSTSAQWLGKKLTSKQKVLLVHNTFSRDEDIMALLSASKDVFFCLCPKANWFISHQLPDIKLISSKTQNITLGTDSLASNDKLDMLDEMRLIQNQIPEIKLDTLLKWACLNGAKALDLDDTFGSFEKNKTPGIVHLSQIDTKNMLILPESASRML